MKDVRWEVDAEHGTCRALALQPKQVGTKNSDYDDRDRVLRSPKHSGLAA